MYTLMYCYRAFQLVWHQDAAIKTECLNAFSNVYMTDGNILDEPQPLSAQDTADHLIDLCLQCAGEGQPVKTARPVDTAVVSAALVAAGSDTETTDTSAVAEGTGSSESTETGVENDISSLEQIIGELFLLEKFHSLRNQVYNHLWFSVEEYGNNLTSSTSTTTTATASQASAKQNSLNIGASFRLLSMIIRFSKEEQHATVIKNALNATKVELITQVGFHSAVYRQQDFFTLKSACILLQHFPSYIYAMNTTKKVNTLVTDTKSIPESHVELQKAYDVTKLSLCTLLLGNYCGEDKTLTGYV